jgi:hypothetical protein
VNKGVRHVSWIVSLICANFCALIRRTSRRVFRGRVRNRHPLVRDPDWDWNAALRADVISQDRAENFQVPET